MKFIHIITIEQLPDGSTRLEQSTRKEGDGLPSVHMRGAMKAWYDAFGQFFAEYNPTMSSTDAMWGRSIDRPAADIRFDWD